ncbi:serine protease inhibitor 42Dd-like [Drosophila biarmipes]|uniref:serine protease inhibitor 42Dd-like n=1 Tax=Drosophila biarmipes TaxID=125945 RepID=UPI0007E6B1C9|nr:serine protease inhibitor 42Dd-like [Drosophila biarmipes]
MLGTVWTLLFLGFHPDGVFCRKFNTLQLVSKVVLELSDINLVVCPAAIEEALAQIYLGAGGETEAELKDLLGYPGRSKTQLLEAYRRAKNPQLNIVSRMFLSKGFHILPAYQKMSMRYFNTDAESTDLSVQGARHVNQWITSKTRGEIVDLVDPFMMDGAAKVILVSAVSSEAFFKFNSVERAFYLPDEKRSVGVKMMDLVGNFKYNFQRKLDSHIVAFPYGKSNLSMALIVPRTFRGITKLEDNLEHLDLVRLKPKRVNVTFPKFKIKYSQDMAQPLIDVGVKSIFSHPNLTHLTKAKEFLKIDSIAHSVSIEVNERGAKLSASADSELEKLRSRKRRFKSALKVTCNRPFLFAIVQGTKIVFFGRLSRPE